MNILQKLTDQAMVICADKKESLRIDNIIIGKTFYTMKGCDTVFADMNFCLVLLEDAYGFSYFQEEIDYKIRKYVNKEIPDVIIENIPMYLRVALTDALYCHINKRRLNSTSNLLRGNLRQKAATRAKILMSSVAPGSNVLLLGAVTEIIEESKQKDIHLEVFDLEPQKVGLEFGGTRVKLCSSQDLLEKIKKADYVIATAMIFVTDTADEIFALVSEYDTKLIMYMESGSNFGQQLLDFGADIVLSEYFPYYDFSGDTRYDIFGVFLDT
jgi:hypothetical protein